MSAHPVSEDLLEVIGGPEDGRQCPLVAESMTIGRGESCSVPLTLDASASRKHARIWSQDGEYWVEDLESSHGTFLGGMPVLQPTRMAHLDELVIGATRLELHRRTSGR